MKQYKIGNLVSYRGTAYRIINIEQTIEGKFYTLEGYPNKLSEREIQIWCIPV